MFRAKCYAARLARRIYEGLYGVMRRFLGLSKKDEAAIEEARRKVASVPNWYHQIEVAPGVVTPGPHNSRMAIGEMDLPESFAGKRVLDVGARDGLFSFEAEKRGGEFSPLTLWRSSISKAFGWRRNCSGRPWSTKP